MAEKKNFTIENYNGTDYDTLYPETNSGQVLLDTTAQAATNLPSGKTLDDALQHITKDGGGFQVGDTLTTARTNLGDKWLLCNGATISSSNYPELVPLLKPSIAQANSAYTGTIGAFNCFYDTKLLSVHWGRYESSSDNYLYYMEYPYSNIVSYVGYDNWISSWYGTLNVFPSMKLTPIYNPVDGCYYFASGPSTSVGFIKLPNINNISDVTYTQVHHGSDSSDACFYFAIGNGYIYMGINSSTPRLYKTSFNGDTTSREIRSLTSFSNPDGVKFRHDLISPNETMMMCAGSLDRGIGAVIFETESEVLYEYSHIGTTGTYLSNIVPINNKSKYIACVDKKVIEYNDSTKTVTQHNYDVTDGASSPIVFLFVVNNSVYVAIRGASDVETKIYTLSNTFDGRTYITTIPIAITDSFQNEDQSNVTFLTTDNNIVTYTFDSASIPTVSAPDQLYTYIKAKS